MAEIRLAKYEDLEALASDVSSLGQTVSNKADSNHTHSYNDLSDIPDIPQAPDLTGYVTLEYFNSELSGKSSEGHTHDYGDISGTPTIPPDVSGRVSELERQVSNLEAELETLRGIVDGLTNSGEPEAE